MSPTSYLAALPRVVNLTLAHHSPFVNNIRRPPREARDRRTTHSPLGGVYSDRLSISNVVTPALLRVQARITTASPFFSWLITFR